MTLKTVFSDFLVDVQHKKNGVEKSLTIWLGVSLCKALNGIPLSFGSKHIVRRSIISVAIANLIKGLQV